MSHSIYFLITRGVHLLDLSGILQVFQESAKYGAHYHLHFLSSDPEASTSSGVVISNLKQPSEFSPTEHDIICVPGRIQIEADYDQLTDLFRWLRIGMENGTRICSICSGAFILAESGLLDGRICTTHWSMTEQLQLRYPKLRVEKDILYTKDENIYTSAGFTTGVDLALFLLEEKHGSEIAAKVARELVVYIRRDGNDQQMSIYLQYRSHQDQKVHTIQDWIIQNIDQKTNIQHLAQFVHTSPRNLTRIFKKVTGITITGYRNQVRIEKAMNLIKNSDYTMEHIAHLCGYAGARQLRTLLNSSFPIK